MILSAGMATNLSFPRRWDNLYLWFWHQSSALKCALVWTSSYSRSSTICLSFQTHNLPTTLCPSIQYYRESPHRHPSQDLPFGNLALLYWTGFFFFFFCLSYFSYLWMPTQMPPSPSNQLPWSSTLYIWWAQRSWLSCLSCLSCWIVQ